MRVLYDSKLPGPVNMGRDEALLEFVRAGRSPTTLRFYGWIVPTISLGASQPWQQYMDLIGPVAGLAPVRRRTGGGAILHDAELTYSLTIRKEQSPEGSFGEVYRLVQEAMAATLCELNLPTTLRPRGGATGPIAQRDIFWCFHREYDYDILVDGKKMGGSAQRRLPDTLLQHGSIMLRRTFQQHPGTTMDAFMPAVTVGELADRLTHQIEKRLGFTGEPGAWLDDELKRSEPLAKEHESMSWLDRR